MKRTVLVVDGEQSMRAVVRMGKSGQLTCFRVESAGVRTSRPGFIEGEAASPRTAGMKQSIPR